MKVLIYGGGAVGLGLASCLLKSKAKVDIVARPQTAAALLKYGLVRSGIFGRFKALPKTFGAFSSLPSLLPEPYDFILVTTKSFDSLKAAQDLSRHRKITGKNTPIVLCQNGLGNAEIFSQYFPKEKIYNARVITGFTRPKHHRVVVTVHADDIAIGSLFGGNLKKITRLTKAMAKGGVPSRPTRNAEKDLWAKMLYNCALNPLGAIFKKTYGALGENPFARFLMDEIIKEIFAVMKKSGYKTYWKTPEDYLKIFYGKQIPATYRHYSSTFQDIKAKKRTEIDALNGAIVRLAKKSKTPVPVNNMVYKLVKFIEQRGLSKS